MIKKYAVFLFFGAAMTLPSLGLGDWELYALGLLNSFLVYIHVDGVRNE